MSACVRACVRLPLSLCKALRQIKVHRQKACDKTNDSIRSMKKMGWNYKAPPMATQTDSEHLIECVKCHECLYIWYRNARRNFVIPPPNVAEEVPLVARYQIHTKTAVVTREPATFYFGYAKSKSKVLHSHQKVWGSFGELFIAICLLLCVLQKVS